MQRIVRGQSATLTHTFYSDGVATDPSPDTATVTITREDGTAIVTGAATTNAGTGIVSYTLTPAQTALVDILTVAWTATFGGQSQVFTDIVEVAGGVLFTIAEARAVTPLSNATTFPTSRIVDMRTMIEQAIEAELGYSTVPRYYAERLAGTGTTVLRIGRPLFGNVPGTSISIDTTIRAATIDDADLTATDVLPEMAGLYYGAGWTFGRRNVIVRYESGAQYPPERLRRAAIRQAKRWLVDGPIDDRATSMSNDDGTFALVTPGIRGIQFDVPELTAAVQQYSLQVAIA